MNTTSHKQRRRAAVAGQPIDRMPYAVWWHDFRREWSAEELADATIETYRKYDWDLVKSNPRTTYYIVVRRPVRLGIQYPPSVPA
jgi:uroporphyrinogen decarboxylase